MLLERRLLRNVDWPVLVAVMIICVLSVIILYSATATLGPEAQKSYVTQQIFGVIAGFILFLFFLWLDYQELARFSRFIYVMCLLMLAAVLVPGLGHEAKGAQSWLGVGPVRIQPSEFAKIFIIITLADFINKRKLKIEKLQDLAAILLHIGIPMGLILLQPDLGTTLVFIAILFGMLLLGGAPMKYILGLLFLGMAATPFVFHFLKPYQRNRLIVFLNPEKIDPSGAGWNVIQSMTAIGSGRFFGKGLGAGTQSQYGFIPEQWTDFIFSVLGEELGFIGAMFLLLLYFFILWRSVKIAAKAKDNFGMLMVVGIVAMWTFHILENIGMTAGMMPVTGIPLPFMSFGRSSFFTNMISLGIILNVGMRRRKILF